MKPYISSGLLRDLAILQSSFNSKKKKKKETTIWKLEAAGVFHMSTVTPQQDHSFLRQQKPS